MVATSILQVVLAASAILLYYAYSRVKYERFERFKRLPQLPPSLIWGHLKALHEGLLKLGDSRMHEDYFFRECGTMLGSPEVYFADLRPVLKPMVHVSSHEVAEQISSVSKTFRYSFPKSPTVAALGALIGKYSIIAAEGEDWKGLRKQLNPGFARSHLIGLLPEITAKTEVFIKRLDGLAHSGVEFCLDVNCLELTFDIIGSVVMGQELHAQEPGQQDPLVVQYRELIATFEEDGGLLLKAKRKIQGIWLARQVNKSLTAVVRQSYTSKRDQAQATEQKTSSARSVLDLSLDGIDEITPKSLQVAADQLKSFIFAGHDTTGIVLQWAFYELSRSPHVLAKLRKELDDVLGVNADPAYISEALNSRGEEAQSKLAYLSAVVKEILRLYPPAATARLAPPGATIKLTNGEEHLVEGAIVYINHHAVQRDPAVYGATCDDFVPERWLGDVSTSDTEGTHSQVTAASIPKSAWRAFERGPRNCIGQELANLEIRAILATAVRRYDFTKVGAGELVLEDGKPVENEKGQYEVKSQMFNMRQVTSKPFDGMRMKVKFHEVGA
ncbi:cytochrome P450 [Aulographum hederae CBS 113979]|uniref:Cytochrome P450 n=1 Tax=Aulographum hederae CBS 113979 TaxID=1176131 RepID=A0A6G1GR81_9PEZI|nr:cytochrome P450 [Aulographum hederae CBS 113979]